MDSRMFRTPQKPSSKRFLANTNVTPQMKLKDSYSPMSLTRSTSGNFTLLPVAGTPPSQIPKVVNPFEAALTERLHLPLICSPSLFQRPNTPQHSSTQFEWTIEEVSSLGPAFVEPHETQFQATPDPDLEAKAQAAISSYFKDQIIVPSPVDCSLRNRKIVLGDILTGNSPPVRSGRRIRDGIAQTVLSIPPVVPAEVEEILKKFLTYTADQQQSPTVSCDITIDYEAQDISLRRKLFGIPRPSDFETEREQEQCTEKSDEEINVIHGDHSPPPKSPDLHTSPLSGRAFATPKFGDNSFGELSPISKLASLDPKPPSPVANVNIIDFDDDSVIQSTQNPPSDIKTPTGLNPTPADQSLYRSTPDRSTLSAVVNMSVDRSCNHSTNKLGAISSSKNLFPADLEVTVSDNSFLLGDDDDMQISQLSAKSTSSSSSSQHPDTPVRHRNRSISRKNLSRSFSCPVTDDEDDMDGGLFLLKNAAILGAKSSPEMREPGNLQSIANSTVANATERSVFYRTDSGFNEMTTQDESKFRNEMEEIRKYAAINENDVSMMS